MLSQINLKISFKDNICLTIFASNSFTFTLMHNAENKMNNTIKEI